MKRSPLPRRKTPIARSTTPIARTGRPNPRGAKAEREQPALDAFRDALDARSRGWCQCFEVRGEDGTPICGTIFRHTGTDPHHIHPSDRDRGVHDPDRGLFICRTAHRAIHDNVEWAYAHGLLGRSGYNNEETPPCPT